MNTAAVVVITTLAAGVAWFWRELLKAADGPWHDR